jgi:HEAT repeat protein
MAGRPPGPVPRVRLKAIAALGKFGPPAVPVLTQALKDADRSVRGDAAEALGWIKPPAEAAVPALIQALNDADTSVQGRAALALRRIAPAAKDIVPALRQVRPAAADTWRSAAIM